jgi:subtilisin family serine protease
VSVSASGLVQAVRPGSATVTVSAGAFSASAGVTVLGETIPGNAGAALEGALQTRAFLARAEDYSLGHPDLAGGYLSFNTLILVFQVGTTVGQANAVVAPLQAEIVGSVPGVPGQTPGMLVLRLPTSTHAQMEATLAALRASPLVRTAVQDGLVPAASVPRSGPATPATWAWESSPSGGNYGLELIRAPQMWNLSAALRKSGAPKTVVGVLDRGFKPAHADLSYRANLTPSGPTPHDTLLDHGTHVAGTIAARFDNDDGIVGTTPFADLVVQPVAPPTGAIAAFQQAVMSLTQSDFQLRGLILHSSRPQVINISLQIAFCQWKVPVDSDISAAAQAFATTRGKLVSDLLANLDAGGYHPLLIVAAGNCAGKQAKWESTWANAAIVHGAMNIVVVESVANAPGSTGGASLSSFSNVSGHVSGPGGGGGTPVVSTAASSPYLGLSGTSMASPHVAGLAAYLWTVDPQLLPGQIRGLLLNQGNTVAVAGGAARRVDAFSTMLDIDRLRGNDRVLKMLVDVDDGSLDGNGRADENGGSITDEDVDADGGPGDGVIDMSDFRRFRDWLLQTENPGGLALDGGAQHGKKDLNGDGQVGTAAQENLYPRGDFNGDGRLHRTATTPARGFTTDVTDLQVLQKLFVDPNYQAAQLSGLLDSGDLTIDVVSCLARPNAVRIATSIRPKGTTAAAQSRSQTVSLPRAVFTAAVIANGYTARAEAFDGANVSLGSSEKDFVLTLGGDAVWKPACADAGTISQLRVQGAVQVVSKRSRPAFEGCDHSPQLPTTIPAPVTGAIGPIACVTESDPTGFSAGVTGEQHYTTSSNNSIPLTLTANGHMTASINSDGNWGLQAYGSSVMNVEFRVSGGSIKLDITGTIEGVMANPLANVQAYTYCDAGANEEGTDWEAGRPTISGPWLPTSRQFTFSRILTPEDHSVSCGAYIFVSENASGPPALVNVSGSARFNYTLRLSPAP